MKYEHRRVRVIIFKKSRSKERTSFNPELNKQRCTSKGQQQISFPNNKVKIQNPNPAHRSVSPSAHTAAVADAPLWTGRRERATHASAPCPHTLPPSPALASARHGRVCRRCAPQSPVPADFRRRRGPVRPPNQKKRVGRGPQTAWREQRSALPGDRQTWVLCGGRWMDGGRWKESSR